MKILLPADGSDHSLRATKKAIDLVKLFDGEIEVVYVVDGSTSKEDVLKSLSKVEIVQKRKERLEPVESLLSNAKVSYTIKFLHGEPGPTIVDYANNDEFEYVVLGSRGLNKVQTLVLGSVSHKVAKRVDCPVMIVK
ncbi:universal stress protein [Halalkalibacter urbisdiaboli]|uniref:universal stress protein n=1 Tax=Halalkalibacter urbisdiaboli TaxID=1960589 RepID=UPI000B43F390|nr:universal stress protein [Halalkalibacter urbisdiaboli]